jgi:hypothetical protein
MTAELDTNSVTVYATSRDGWRIVFDAPQACQRRKAASLGVG